MSAARFKVGEARAHQHLAVVGGERLDQRLQVGREIGGAGVRLGVADFLAQDVGRAQRAGGAGQARVDADQGAAVRLVGAVVGGVGRVVGQRLQGGRAADHQGRDRQLGAQRVRLFQVEVEDGGGLARQRVLHGAAVDVGIAVAVAADPAAHLHVRRVDRLDLWFLVVGRSCSLAVVVGDVALDVVVQPRQFAQEGGAVVRQRVLDLVGHGQLGVAQHAGLPQRGDARAQQVHIGGFFLRRQRQVALGQQAGDVVLGVEDGFALHFGRVGRQHRRDQRLLEEFAHGLLADAGFLELAQREVDAALLRVRAGQQVRAAAADVVLVLGDVGQVREVRKRPHHGNGLFAGQDLEHAVQFLGGAGVGLAAEAHGRLTDGFDHGEHFLALLIAQHVAQQAAEQADIFLEGRVLVYFGSRPWLFSDVVVDCTRLFCHVISRKDVKCRCKGW